MKIFISKFLRYPVACLLVALPLAVHAEAGKVLFVYGKAYVAAADGNRSALAKGSAVESGDTIVTSANGRVQLRMADGGLIALRPQTEFVIEDFNYPASVGGPATVSGEPRSFFALVKGGFRSITGAIGKTDKTDYGVRTPVATIGIRGTDFTAVLCAGACERASDGLYVGVTDGGVVLRNGGGSLDLDPGEYGFAASTGLAPEKSAVAARLLAAATPQAADDTDSDAEAEDTDPQVASVGTSSSGTPVNLTSGGEAVNDNSGAVAYSSGPFAGADGFTSVGAQGTTGKVVDGEGNPLSFNGNSPLGAATLDRASSQTVNVGRDADRTGATGLEWGRWSTGNIALTGADGSSSENLDSSSLHYVTGADGAPQPVLPTTGTADFALIGNTNPTDGRGNVGTLGSASLSADFTDQTVDADVSLSFDATSEVWDASADDVDINSDATFGGQFDEVTVTDTVTGQESGAAGDLNGFFSADDNGALSGAGMSYSLTDDDATVSGAAAFQVEDGN